MATKFTPLGSKVLVLRDETPDRVGNIVIPEVAKESERPFWCNVVAVGPGEWVPPPRLSAMAPGFKEGVWVKTPMWVKPGDRVLINRYGGPRIDLDGVEHLVLDHTDIKAIAE